MSREKQPLPTGKKAEIVSRSSFEAMAPNEPYSRSFKVAAVSGVICAALSFNQSVIGIRDAVNEALQRDRQPIVEAEKMSLLYEGADVAVVAYQIHPDQATQMASEIEDTFNTMSDGIITLNVDVVMPSEEAQERYSEDHPDNCIDKTDVTSYDSYIAEQEMPELKNYDKILALNALLACQDMIAGVASSLNDKYSEVFGAAVAWNTISENDGDQMVIEETENGSQTVSFIGSPVAIGVHELFHLFGLGHAGVLSTKMEARGQLELLKIYSDDPTHVDFDVREAIDQKVYTEYGNPGVMGQGLLDYSNELSVVEKFNLEWPQRQLGQETNVTLYDIGQSAVSFDIDTFQDAIATYQFKTPIMMKGNEYTYLFDRIVFVPGLREPGLDDAPATHVAAYLMSEGNNIAELGPIVNINEQDTVYTIQLDDERLEVTISYTTNEVHLKKLTH